MYGLIEIRLYRVGGAWYWAQLVTHAVYSWATVTKTSIVLTISLYGIFKANLSVISLSLEKAKIHCFWYQKMERRQPILIPVWTYDAPDEIRQGVRKDVFNGMLDVSLIAA